MSPKDAGGVANSVDSDQTAALGADPGLAWKPEIFSKAPEFSKIMLNFFILWLFFTTIWWNEG